MINYSSPTWRALDAERRVALLGFVLGSTEDALAAQCEINSELSRELELGDKERYGWREDFVKAQELGKTLVAQLEKALIACAASPGWERFLGFGVARPLDELLRQDKKILAIKEFRRATGLGLLLSKVAIEARMSWLNIYE